MILQLLIDLFLGFIDIFLSFIPNISIDGNIMGSISTFGQYVGYVDTIVDLSVMGSCIALILVFDNLGFIVKVFNFILRKIPFIN